MDPQQTKDVASELPSPARKVWNFSMPSNWILSPQTTRQSMKLPLPDCLAWEIGAANVEVQSDSQVVVGHIQGEFEAQWDNMIKHLNNVHELQS
jgi:hypothetical protein